MRMLWKLLKSTLENVLSVCICSHTHELGGAVLPGPSSAKPRMTSALGGSDNKRHEKAGAPYLDPGPALIRGVVELASREGVT